MVRRFAVVLCGWSAALTAQIAAPYVPPPGAWPRTAPGELGLDAAALAKAVALGAAGEIDAPRGMREFQARSFGSEPHSEPIGPLFDRGGAAGAIVYRGHLVGAWGDVLRADMCNSVTKSFLTAVVGLAWQKGHIASVHDAVAAAMPAGVDLFAGAGNQAITWDHLLRQTSDWRGTLWGKPD